MRGLATLLRRVRRRRVAAIERRLFDPDFYARAYPDVARSSTDGFTHYMTHGWREGRDPSPHFATLYYRDRHLAGRCINPLTHYASLGALLRLTTQPKSADAYVALQASLVRRHFSETYYRGLHPDASDDDPLRHYLSVGWQDGRSGSPAFDPRAYLARHPHVATLGVSAHYHFASQMRFQALGPGRDGRRVWRPHEARSPRAARIRARITREFDQAYYLRSNADIRERGIDPLTHYLTAGWRENRSPNRWFDPAYYLQNNPGAALTDVPPFYHFLLLGRRRGARPNPVGRRLYPPLRAPPAEAWRDVAPAADAASAACIVLMPVHGGYHETLAAVHAVLASRQATPFALHVTDDCTPDAELAAALAAHAAAGLFVYEANPVNRGFVATVNAGLSRYSDRDVVLLNADTRVFGNWLDRILAHARRDPSIATITPLSNNATVASYPLRDVNNVIEMEPDAEGLDALAAACNAGRTSEMLVGVGFCLFISAASRAVVGLLDTETFGRGYGEENDFCLRAAAAGFRNVLAEDVFVYHVGEVSFATVADDWRSHGETALLAKHPDYPLKLVRHFAVDPAEEARIRLDLMRLAREAGRGSVVHVFHTLGGGIATHVEHEVLARRHAGRSAILMRVAGADRWSVEIQSASPDAPYVPNLRSLSINQFRPLLADFLGWLSPDLIHIHSLVGLDWSATTGFFDLVRGSGCAYAVTLHDYSALCHRFTLLQPNGCFCGLAAVETCRTCIASDRTYPEAVDPQVRREAFAKFLAGAHRVFAPSHDVKARFEGAGAAYAITVRPHAEAELTVPAYRRPQGRAVLDVVTVGAIGHHKGSNLILSLARDARSRKLPIRYRIVGYSDLTEAMAAAGVVETGRYASADEAAAAVVAAEPACILLPSIWPETYLYTLSLAFALRCPPVVFDLGAQAERVRDAGFGVILPYALTADIPALNDSLMAFREGGRVWPPASENRPVGCSHVS